VDAGTTQTRATTAEELGFDSMPHYQYVHFTDVDRGYAAILPDVVAEWERLDREDSIPYFPHVSLGWDNNPRFKEFRPNIVKNATPAEIRKSFEAARAFVDAHPGPAPARHGEQLERVDGDELPRAAHAIANLTPRPAEPVWLSPPPFLRACVP
jgi:hypothetical protein